MGLLKRLFGEKRSQLLSPPDWLYRALGGAEKTRSGITVSPDKALTLSAYFGAIRAIAEDVGKLPLIVYRRMDRGKERATEHPLYGLLHDSPNPEMSSQTFRETLTGHALGWGNGYAEIARDTSGRARGLWPLDPRQVRLERGPDRRLRYVCTGDGPTVTLPMENVFHLHGMGFDGITGYSIAHLARESIGVGLAAEKSGAGIFGSGMRPSAWLSFPPEVSGSVTDEIAQGIADQYERMFAGPDKHGRIVVARYGETLNPWTTIPAKDAQWIESRQFTVLELCRWLRVPPHKLGQLEDATLTNIRQLAHEYVGDTLHPWFTRWEMEIQRKLLGKGSVHFAEILFDALLRGNTEDRYNAYRTAILSGWMSRNEARVLENLNPEPGLDAFLEPLNTGAASPQGAREKNAPDDGDAD